MRPSELKANVGEPLLHLEDLGEILKTDFLFLAFWHMPLSTFRDVIKAIFNPLLHLLIPLYLRTL